MADKTHDEMLAMLKESVDKTGGMAEWSRENNIDYQLFQFVMSGTRRMPDSIAHKLGYRKSDKYEKLKRRACDGVTYE